MRGKRRSKYDVLTPRSKSLGLRSTFRNGIRLPPSMLVTVRPVVLSAIREPEEVSRLATKEAEGLKVTGLKVLVVSKLSTLALVAYSILVNGSSTLTTSWVVDFTSHSKM